jgi:molybdopterin converting factor small subunit
MTIRVKLMGSFRSKTPPGGRIEVPSGATLVEGLEKLGITPSHVHMVLVNGAMEKDHSRALADSDELTVFPPVAGG